jgi:hypothetical protein
LIGVSLAVFAILYGIYQAKLGQAPGLPVKWLGFAIMTGIVFLNGIRSYRASWGQRRYWVLLAIFSILHFGVGFIIVSRLGKVGLINFAIATIVEYFVLRAYLDHLLNRRQ